MLLLMQRLIVLLAMAAALLPVRAEAQHPVARALVQFEENVTWESVSPKWRGLRAPWVADVLAAQTAGKLGLLMWEFEEWMERGALESYWTRRRPGWVADAQSAPGYGAVARLLIELEEATLWAAVYPKWRQQRPAWRQALEGTAAQR
ncbi:MAG TPA: hypothetical protein VEC14_03900 [Reyranellaceae bacterium]|nr:hypothetical protein [Reyranellaceae bacterium]